MSNEHHMLRQASPANIALAANMLQDSQCVAFPTETVYGLGALAHEAAAVRQIFTIKGRPSNNPLIVHVADRAMAGQYGVLNDCAYALADAFWPAALSLIVPVKEGVVAPEVLAGNETIALRVPAHPVAQALIRAVGAGIAAPSANRSGKISPSRAAHVVAEFAHHTQQPAMVLDGGAARIGLESTVVRCVSEGAEILRAGSITAQQLARIVPLVSKSKEDTGHLPSPGMLSSHYAPNASMRLNARSVQPHEALLAFGMPCTGMPAQMLNLSEASDVDEAASHLYDYVRVLDATHDHIAVMPIPEKGIGLAINDRLRRAAVSGA